MIQAETSILSPLSYIDHAGVEVLLSTLSYVLAGPLPDAQIAKLKSAAIAVADKYRMVAGHIEALPAPRKGCFGVRVPLGRIDASDRVHFTVADERAGTLAAVMAKSGSDACARFASQHKSPGQRDMTVVAPPHSVFRHKSVTGSLSALAKSKAPMFNIHVTVFSDFTCVGVSLPHGVFDGKGQGMIIAGISAELQGISWVPPMFGPSNVLQDTFEAWNALNDARESAGEVVDMSDPMVEALKREFVPLGVASGSKLAYHLGMELLWRKAENRSLFLSRATVDAIVKPIKESIKARNPGAFVSTGDVLLMWFVRAAHSTEVLTDDRQISVLSAVCMRETLTAVDSEFARYPHNCMTSCTLPLMNKKELVVTGDLGDMALTHRKSLDQMRNLSFIKNWVHHMHKNGSSSIPARGNGYDAWLSTNQCQGKTTKIDFGAPLVGYFYLMNVMPDHTILTNELHDGFMMQSTMRKSHWDAVDAAVARLGHAYTSSA
ncbi:hypothetical protein BKA62DRAFT_718215 [Auriculariales sp. MPI-PUGE-AT-0066]|nr:hypothetical protein BKA62DRAFT_718215 [Auriculariales sp. MPI-PUGE-AT-0066]